jgi:hypothetical protein
VDLSGDNKGHPWSESRRNARIQARSRADVWQPIQVLSTGCHRLEQVGIPYRLSDEHHPSSHQNRQPELGVVDVEHQRP